MSNSNPPTEQAPAPLAPPMNIMEATIPTIGAGQTQIKPHDCQLAAHPTNLLIEEAFGAFVKDMACMMPRLADIDSAELLVRSVFNRLINALREPYMDAIRVLDQRVSLANRQRYHTPRLFGFMDRTTPKLCTLKENHQHAILAYQTRMINYLRSLRASERTYQATLISLQKSQLAAGQKIGFLHTRLRADLEDYQRRIISTNELITALRREQRAEFAANPTDAARLMVLRKYQDHSLLHQATMLTNAQKISEVEERMRIMIAARQVHVFKTAREIAVLEVKHDRDVAACRAELKAQGAALMNLVYCQHEELALMRTQLMGEVSAACQKVVTFGAVEAGGSTDPDADLD